MLDFWILDSWILGFLDLWILGFLDFLDFGQYKLVLHL